MSKITEIIEEIGHGQVRFNKLLTICKTYFGEVRIQGSHHIFKTPWPGDPRINLQKVKGGIAKPYQVQQVIKALQELEEQKDEEQDQDNKE